MYISLLDLRTSVRQEVLVLEMQRKEEVSLRLMNSLVKG